MHILKSNYFICTSALIVGYGLHLFNGKAIELSRQHLGISADFFEGLKEEEYRKKHIETLAQKAPTYLSRQAYVRQEAIAQCGKGLLIVLIEEIGFRYYLQKRLLPPLIKCMTLKFVKPLSMGISAVCFSTSHLWNKHFCSQSQKNAVLINTLLLGLFSSLSSEIGGLQASIALHVGFNARSWKLTYYDCKSALLHKTDPTKCKSPNNRNQPK